VCDLAHRHVGSIVQIDRGPLGGRELLERMHEVRQSVLRRVRRSELGHLDRLLPAARKLGARDPERDPVQVGQGSRTSAPRTITRANASATASSATSRRPPAYAYTARHNVVPDLRQMASKS